MCAVDRYPKNMWSYSLTGNEERKKEIMQEEKEGS
jgi:hypothetical protein